jgi:hypothetical protein
MRVRSACRRRGKQHSPGPTVYVGGDGHLQRRGLGDRGAALERAAGARVLGPGRQCSHVKISAAKHRVPQPRVAFGAAYWRRWSFRAMHRSRDGGGGDLWDWGPSGACVSWHQVALRDSVNQGSKRVPGGQRRAEQQHKVYGALPRRRRVCVWSDRERRRARRGQQPPIQNSLNAASFRQFFPSTSVRKTSGTGTLHSRGVDGPPEEQAGSGATSTTRRPRRAAGCGGARPRVARLEPNAHALVFLESHAPPPHFLCRNKYPPLYPSNPFTPPR